MAAQQTMTKHLWPRLVQDSNESSDQPSGVYAPNMSAASAVAAVPSFATATTSVSGGMSLIGVNISGGEYGPTGAGTVGYDYTYPSASEISYYASKGMTVIRVPFQLERLEPTASGPLDSAQVADLQQVIAAAAASGLKVILDPHNYGSAWGSLIGSTPASLTAYANFWAQMATAFKGDSNVLFGLMNEPNAQTPQQWAQADNAAIAAIRQAGATQEILVPGTDWTGAWSWISSGNSAATNPSTIVDPLHNYAFEVHQYLDSDGSGTNYGPITDPNIGVSRLTAITQWAEQAGAKLFLGEFGVPSDSQSLAAMKNMLTYMEQNASAWQGATYWAGGAWLGSYPFSIEPQNGQDAPQMTVLQQFAPGTQPPPTTTTQPVVTVSPGQTSVTASNSLVQGSGSFNILISGSFDTIAFAGGAEIIRAPLGHNAITTGASNDKISFGGTGNTINAGAGTNILTDSGTGNTLVLPAASQGYDRIYGPVLQNGDTFDLRPALAATGWDGTAGSLSNWLSVQNRYGNTAVYLKPKAGGPSYAVAALEGTTASLAQVLQHSIT
ncbi:MAG TPA: glycoside hydrolase family 5 protein [Acetobacteraceae bacterium]|nr:glycoside hydrolase family 5 protein [Acetobacteraceae bacterium]